MTGDGDSRDTGDRLTITLPAELAAWLASRTDRSEDGTLAAAAVEAIAMAKSLDEAGRAQRERALSLTADDLRALADLTGDERESLTDPGAEIREALAAVERGETVEREDYTRYAGEDYQRRRAIADELTRLGEELDEDGDER